MVERKAAWGKTGIIALRDLQLTAVETGWLEGEQGCTASGGLGCSGPNLHIQKQGESGVLQQRGFGRRDASIFGPGVASDSSAACSSSSAVATVVQLQVAGTPTSG
jgi:hypothetical protein